MATGGHTRLENGVLAVLLRPGSIPTSSARVAPSRATTRKARRHGPDIGC